jgi:transcriptional regulator with XRE-family HTH domain
MELFAKRIRERARELGLSDAEVARRAGLSERRYAYYATAEREPNLATLVRICEVLAATPNAMLLAAEKTQPLSGRERLIARINAATSELSVRDLKRAACQIECLTTHHSPRATRRKAVA